MRKKAVLLAVTVVAVTSVALYMVSYHLILGKFNRLKERRVASLGCNRKLFIPAATFSDAVLTVSTALNLRPGITLELQIGYSEGLNSRYFSDDLTTGLRFIYEPKRQDASDR